jgi:hypothetical protein
VTEDLSKEADRKLEAALAATGARDPREFYRERLRDLKRDDNAGYERAVAHYRDVLIPEVASGRARPLEAWTEYGRRLAEALAPGRTVVIDATGRARPWEGPTAKELVVHLPDARGGRALLVGLPADLSDAQRATYDVLVAGKQRIQG